MRKLDILKIFTICILMSTSLSAFAQPRMNNFDGNAYFDFVDTRAVINNPSSIASVLELTSSYNDETNTGWGGSILSNLANLQAKQIIKADPYEACGALTNGAAVSGNICLIKRGNCEFGEKALRAQTAGAIAVIIVNNVPGGPVGMGEGAQGGSVTIPVIMISDVQGALIEQELNNSTAVDMSFLRWGKGLTNDLAIVRRGQSLWHSYSVPYQNFAGIGTPEAYKGQDAAVVANFGTSTATNVKLISTVYWTPKGSSARTEIRKDSVTYGSSFPPADSIIVPIIDGQYDINATGEGRYDVFYEVKSDNTDDYPGDDTMTYSFYVDGRKFSKSRYNFADGEPFARVGYRSGTDGTDLTWGPMYYVKNGGYEFEKMEFGISTSATALNLEGRSDILGLIYKWVDGANGGLTDSFVQAVELDLVGTANKVFAAGDSSGDMYSVDVRDAFDDSKTITSEANTWYWAAIALPGSSTGDPVFLLCDGQLNYFTRHWARIKSTNSWRESYAPLFGGVYSSLSSSAANLTIMYPFEGTLDEDSARFSNQKDGLVPSVALQMSLFPVGVKQISEKSVDINFYPNPVTDILNADINLSETADEVTYRVIDGLGRIVYTKVVNNVKTDKVSISTDDMAAGNYNLIVTANGSSVAKKFTIVK